MTVYALALTCLCITASSVAGAVNAGASQRMQEVLECRPGEMVTWKDGVDRPARAEALVFTYRPEDAPRWFSEATVSAMIDMAASAWSACGISGTRLRAGEAASAGQQPILIQWNERESRGLFALANISQNTLSLSAKAFELLRSRNPRHDAGETLQMVISHEMGHFFGLMAHSRRCVDVLSYYDNGKGEKCIKRDPADTGGVTEYRYRFPTACDIARCRQINRR